MASKPIRNNDPQAVDRGRTLRGRMTAGELRLWRELKARKLGFHVRRNTPILRYFVDFYILEAKLAIEVDGKSHPAKAAYETERDDALRGLGLHVLHVTNGEVGHELTTVIDRIYRLCYERSGRDPLGRFSNPSEG